MAFWEVTINGAKELVVKMRIYDDGLVTSIVPAYDKVGEALLASAKRHAPVSLVMQQPKLVDSLRYEIEDDSIALVSDAPWAWYQEHGFRPHWVSLYKHPRAMAWFMAHQPFVTRVPSAMFVRKYTPYAEPAFNEIQPDAGRMIFKAHDKYFTKVWRGK